MNFLVEISWPQFQQLDYVRKLPLNEQVKFYNQYIWDLEQARQNWLIYQNKGPATEVNSSISEGFLLQEDLFDLLQEDGSNIIIT